MVGRLWGDGREMGGRWEGEIVPSSRHLLDLLSGDAPPSETDVKELYDTFQAHD